MEIKEAPQDHTSCSISGCSNEAVATLTTPQGKEHNLCPEHAQTWKGEEE